MNDKVYTEKFKVNSLAVRPNHRLGLVGLLGMLQDVAQNHAEMHGFGYDQMLKSQTFWVLSRQKLVMDQWPRWRDVIEIKTWARPLDGSRAYRDFEIFLLDKKIGECSTTWVILDGRTRRPKSPDFSLEGFARTDDKLGFEPGKVDALDGVEVLKEFEVRNSDLDMNLHVNNTKYAQWISDSIPFERHSDGIVREYEVNFLAETHLGDHVAVEHKTFESGDCFDLRFQGRRERDAKIVFTARLKAKG